MSKPCRVCRTDLPLTDYPLRIVHGKCYRERVCRSCNVKLAAWVPLDNRPSLDDYRGYLKLTTQEKAVVTQAVGAYVAYRQWADLRRAPINDDKFKAYKLTTAYDILEPIWRTDVKRWHQLCVLVAMTATERLEAAA